MRKARLNKVIFMTLMAMTFSMPVSAAWNSENNKWIWTENDKKVVGWKEIDDKWYHFDENGYMDTGWVQDNSKWYRFGEDGVMVYGWTQDNGKWYHMSSTGALDTGWKAIDGEWYMFNDSGSMCTGWINDNGTWYYADMSGKLQTGDISIDGKNYIFDQNGAMLNKEMSTEIEPAVTESFEKTGYVNTKNDMLNVRTDSDITSSIVNKLPRGAEVSIIGEPKNGFYPISLNNTTAWVSSDWISFEKPTEKEQNVIYDSNSKNKEQEKENSKNHNVVALGGIRTTEPSLDDIHYYSNSNIFYKIRLSPPFFNSSGQQIKGNCTWYSWGRAWELTGKQPTEANFIGNAYEWWNANIKSGKYEYGLEPRVGSIAVWKANLPGSGGCGHVAVVEKIENGKIYISESMWHGDCFKYQEIYSTEYLYGYIYLDEPNY